jgi:hypothetical protein
MFQVSFEYDSNQRDEFGFPIFGIKTMTVYAVNEQSARANIERLFGGRHHVNITEISKVED